MSIRLQGLVHIVNVLFVFSQHYLVVTVDSVLNRHFSSRGSEEVVDSKIPGRLVLA